MSGEAGQAAVDVLVEHRIVSHFNVCACGWDGDVGDHHAHARHVVHELQMAGLDVVRR